jgi:tagaturonate reductase
VRGLKNGLPIEENVVNSSISRVLNATEQWAEVLECAHNSHMQVIVSNTTEVGIELVNDDIRRHPPVSFPGKLLAFLYERFKAFGGSSHSGMVIVPTELIVDNGKKLESIVLELAHLNGLEDSFIEWIENHNSFCNSLVDRIVPGKPEADLLEKICQGLGYSDQLLTMSEAYALWAIEGGEHEKNILSFASADDSIVIEPDIEGYRELKLRLLNGTHTFSSGVAFLSGCETVKQAMDDELVRGYISDLMLHEIAPSIPYEVSLSKAQEFGNKVLDRFSNPNIRHFWSAITVNYSSKMKLRCVPLLMKHFENTGTIPDAMAFGFAAYLYFMKPVQKKGEQYFGELNGQPYLIQDEQAAVYYRRWAGLSPVALVKETLRDGFWEADLSALPGFEQAVIDKLNLILAQGIKESLETVHTKKIFAA